MNEKKIVVYTVNFGNYRNELEDGIDTLNFDPRIDYIFFCIFFLNSCSCLCVCGVRTT